LSILFLCIFFEDNEKNIDIHLSSRFLRNPELFAKMTTQDKDLNHNSHRPFFEHRLDNIFFEFVLNRNIHHDKRAHSPEDNLRNFLHTQNCKHRLRKNNTLENNEYLYIYIDHKNSNNVAKLCLRTYRLDNFEEMTTLSKDLNHNFRKLDKMLSGRCSKKGLWEL